MSLFRRDRAKHDVEVITFDDDDDPMFVAMCVCGTVSPPFPTKDAAFSWAREHSPDVSEEVRVLTGEGGEGWLCMFCGVGIEEAPLRISVSWTDDGVDDEQWYAAHRTCLVERMARDEPLAPRFDVPEDEAGKT